MAEVCVDAVAVKLVLPEPKSELVQGEWRSLVRESVTLVAPWL